jgi:hypothetical protein
VSALSYLQITRLSGDVFMGGLLSVSELGLPTEFFYSEPLKPSKLQISLYGSTIGRYLMLDVVGKGLIEASAARGVPVVLGSVDLLPLATRVKRPLCFLTASHQPPLTQEGEIQPADPGNTEFVVQLSELQSPWRIRIYDKANFPLEQHMRTLIECSKRFELTEPLGRISRTLEQIKEPEQH